MPGFNYSRKIAEDAVNAAVAANHPASTNNAVARYDGSTGKLQNSSAIIDDSGRIRLQNGITVVGGDVSTGTHNSYFMPYHAGEGRAVKSDGHGKMVWDFSPVHLGQADERLAQQTVVEHFNAPHFDAGEYYHIRTPLNTKKVSRMFHFHLTGYAYGDRNILDIVYVGYCYSSSGNLVNEVVKDTSTNLADALVYEGSDNFIYLRFRPADTYYVSFRIEHMVVGNGQAFKEDEVNHEFEVLHSTDATL